MNKILSFFALFFCVGALAGEPFFCTKAGTKLYYERYKAGTRKIVQTTDFEIDSLVSTGNGKRQVIYGVTMKKNGKKPIFGGRADLVAQIDANGDTHMDFGATVLSFLKNLFPNAKSEITGTDALLPADAKPGDVLPDASCKVSLGLLSVTIEVTERQILRRERISTPAGDFDCIVVRERKKEDAPLHHRDNYLENWYVPNMGYVRHDVYNDKMELEQTELLQLMR